MNTVAKRTANPNKEPQLAVQWKNIDWKKAERFVNKIQARIAKATTNGNTKLAKELQRMLRHSLPAKLMAVKKVTSNKGKKTPGIDGEVWATPAQKFVAAQSIDVRRHKPKPLRRVYIEKGNGKKRPLGIPTMRDRAVQCVEAAALDPVIESTGDTTSFGFRKGRSCADAMEYIFIILSKRTSPTWILEGDIKACFDEISHEWLLQHAQMDRVTLARTLKSGYIEQGKLFPTLSGAPQGGVISPILANQTLNGMSVTLRGEFPNQKRPYFRPKVNLVRYADDLIITAASKEIAQRTKETVRRFVEARGLRLSDEKTLITEIHEGFDFLGWNFRKYANNKLIIKPSKKSVRKLLKTMKSIIDNSQCLDQDALIARLNPIITGWGNYHQGVSARKTFQLLDNAIFQALWAWARKRHPNKGKTWIKQKYWKTEGSRHWVFRGKTKKLKLFTDIRIVRHTRLKLDKNPYIDRKYFAQRKLQLEANKLSGRAKRIFQAQKGLCPLCNGEMGEPRERKLYHRIITGQSKAEEKSELLFMHIACVRQSRKVNTGMDTIMPCYS